MLQTSTREEPVSNTGYNTESPDKFRFFLYLSSWTPLTIDNYRVLPSFIQCTSHGDFPISRDEIQTCAVETLQYSPTLTHLNSNLYFRVTLALSSESLAVLAGAEIRNSVDIQKCH